MFDRPECLQDNINSDVTKTILLGLLDMVQEQQIRQGRHHTADEADQPSLASSFGNEYRRPFFVYLFRYNYWPWAMGTTLQT